MEKDKPKRRTFQPDPKLTENLREDVFASARYFQENPETITKALTDPHTREEMRQLVSDLYSLLEVIVEGD